MSCEEKKKDWEKALRRVGFSATRFSGVCYKHFKPDDFKKNSTRLRLKFNAVPSIFEAYPSYLQTKEKPQRRILERVSPIISTISSTSGVEPVLGDPSTSTCSTVEPVLSSGNEERMVVVDGDADDDTFVDYYVTTKTEFKRLKKCEKRLKMSEENLSDLKTNYKLNLEKLQAKIKNLNQKVRRKSKKIENMKELIQSLKDKSLVDMELGERLNNEFGDMTSDIVKNIVHEQKKSKGGHRYSQEIKKFALTLFYNSPKAYNYCRNILKLPHPSSLHNWISNVSAEPGFFEHVFNKLKLHPKDMKDCTIIMDSMAIRKQVIYNEKEKKMYGYCDAGQIIIDDPSTEATEALVFLLVNSKGTWKWPIAYFLINKCKAEFLSGLITSALDLAANADLNVHGVIFDGAPTNFAALSGLGCNFQGDLKDLKGSFLYNQRRYYAIPDACHMLKLARNCIASQRILKSDTGLIDWSYVNKLYHLQDEIGLKFANKLSRAHIDWERNKMKVKLAAQTLSNSTADALEFLMLQGLQEFQGAEETIKFIRAIDRLNLFAI